jgi:peptidyl-tRNA hydrolase, PTH1 family
MYIIAGLGNPGEKYDNTRHNAGFLTIDALASKYNIDVREKAHKALIGKGVIEGQKVILAKPQTYMNVSGESIHALVDYYKIAQEELIIIFDDISLEPGQLRIRKKGSAGGHNGIKSIIAHLGTQEFTRIKVGVGEKPPKMDLADYVLGRFLKEEQDTMKQAFENAAGAAAAIVTQGADAAMNLYNGSKKKSEKKTEKPEEKKSEEKKAEEKTAEGKKPEVQTPGTGASSAS